jgi:hypothetical protein
MIPTMRVPIKISLEPSAPFGVGDANDEKERGGSDINEVRVSRRQNDNDDEQGQYAFYKGSFFHGFFCS